MGYMERWSSEVQGSTSGSAGSIVSTSHRPSSLEGTRSAHSASTTPQQGEAGCEASLIVTRPQPFACHQRQVSFSQPSHFFKLFMLMLEQHDLVTQMPP